MFSNGAAAVRDTSSDDTSRGVEEGRSRGALSVAKRRAWERIDLVERRSCGALVMVATANGGAMEGQADVTLVGFVAEKQWLLRWPTRVDPWKVAVMDFEGDGFENF